MSVNQQPRLKSMMTSKHHQQHRCLTHHNNRKASHLQLGHMHSNSPFWELTTPSLLLLTALDCSIAYTLETMKNGTVVEQSSISTKGHYTFGRTEANDFRLEHPSISRLHAVLQFSAGGESFLYDAGSAHGTFLNKQRLKPEVHVPIR